MLFYFDVIYGLDRVRDPEGSILSEIASALAEAQQIAIEIAVEELRKGNRLVADWRVEVLDETRALVGSALFYDVLFEPPADRHSAALLRRHLLGEATPYPPYQRSQEALAESREIVANVRNVFREIRQRLDAIA